MSEQPETIHPEEPKPERSRSRLAFPVYALADCVVVADTIHKKGGGALSNDQLAAYLGYKSANNGAFINKISASKLFGLIEGPPNRLTYTQLAQKILLPVRPQVDPQQALIEAFFRVPLYKAIYDEYRSTELPPKFGFKNALRTMFGVTPQRIDRAYSAFMASADTAGFFTTRGSRTHLILPALPQVAPQVEESEPDDSDGTRIGNGGGGGGQLPPREPPTREELQNEYIATLIGLLKEQGQQGDVNAELMARIEKLLEMA
jgi:hypothetical protein